MKITPKEYAIGLYEATKDAPKEEMAEKIAEFVKILKIDNVLSIEKKIVEEYEKYYRKQKNILRIKIRSGEKVSPETISTMMKNFSKQVEIEEEIDEDLIGGIVVEIESDLMIDGSVKKKLEVMKEAIG